MIDESKYTGHTPAPWEIYGERICAQDACDRYRNVGGDIATVIDEVNTHLIADAPLLLAEVLRLREVIDKEHPTFDWASRQTIANLDAEVKRLREMYEDANRYLDLMVERFGIEALVEMVGEEE
tara:strand:- start:36 stop:407 length:372 start_codon:yes stop_codon:yes gene_type:complete